jgi:hypothetical protein
MSSTKKLPNMGIGIRSWADGEAAQRYNATIELPRDPQRSNWEVSFFREEGRR